MTFVLKTRSNPNPAIRGSYTTLSCGWCGKTFFYARELVKHVSDERRENVPDNSSDRVVSGSSLLSEALAVPHRYQDCPSTAHCIEHWDDPANDK
jgi:hypothetical protein